MFPAVAGEVPRSQKEGYITKAIWDEYKGQKCELGIPFEACLLPGFKVQQDELKIGIIAASHDCYNKFHKLFDKYFE